MRQLAIDLVRATTADEIRSGLFRVGGEPQVAILEGGKVSEAPDIPPVNAGVGSELSGNEFGLGPTNCHGAAAMGSSGDQVIRVEADLTDCTQELDNIVFHDSKFTDSTLVYSGRGRLLFDSSNQVRNTSLVLGDVDANRKDVKQLVCAFTWRDVSSKVKVTCSAQP